MRSLRIAHLMSGVAVVAVLLFVALMAPSLVPSDSIYYVQVTSSGVTYPISSPVFWLITGSALAIFGGMVIGALWISFLAVRWVLRRFRR